MVRHRFQGFFAPWRIGTATAIAGVIAASAAMSSLPQRGPVIDDRYVPMWVLGGRPDLPLDRVQRFTRRADPAQRAAVARVIVEEAQAQGVPVHLAMAVAMQESGMRPAHAVTGPPTRYGRAVGTMQVLPSTGRAMGCGNLRDTRQNVRCGVTYLRRSLERHRGDPGMAALEYHGGPDRRLWGRRTHHYREMVLRRAGSAGSGFRAAAWAPAARPGNEHFMQWWLNR